GDGAVINERKGWQGSARGQLSDVAGIPATADIEAGVIAGPIIRVGPACCCAGQESGRGSCGYDELSHQPPLFELGLSCRSISRRARGCTFTVIALFSAVARGRMQLAIAPWRQAILPSPQPSFDL